MINKELQEQVEKVFEKLDDHEDCRAALITYVSKDATVATMASGSLQELSALVGSLEAEILCKTPKKDRKRLREFIKNATDLCMAEHDVKSKDASAVDGLELIDAIVNLLKKSRDETNEDAD